ncbi:MAG: hypothetical protein SA378_02095 [Sedimentibacter sp.]|uniref:hypothetical protein n=1 Tax=Sedimentibacter sp. TaxID=1960295 RepID=UPI0029816E55|nr:hypothetical protein [Sedimentibacter sp.]MDW5298919.1 hypothetical protein [Sedimentibacter sp.]
MKIIVFAMMILLGHSCQKEANENFLVICRGSKKIIIIDYLDSRRGISQVTQSILNDTLYLKVFVSTKVPQKGYEIQLDSNVRCISIGDKFFQLNQIKECTKTRSGKDALEELKKH